MVDLVELLLEAIKPPPPPRRATRPTRGSVQRRLAAKKQRGAIKGQRQAFVQSLSHVPAAQSRADFRIELPPRVPRLCSFALRVPLP